MPALGEAPPRATERRPRGSPLLRRLPLLALVLLGVWLWRSPLLPQEREIVWELPRGEPLYSAEVQIWQGQSLLKREERSFSGTLAGEWVERISLKRGDYRAEVFVKRAPDATSEHTTRALHLSGPEAVRLPLLPR